MADSQGVESNNNNEPESTKGRKVSQLPPGFFVPKFLGSTRFVLVIFCLLANLILFYVRFSFSIAVVCMVGSREEAATQAELMEAASNGTRHAAVGKDGFIVDDLVRV